MGFRPSEYNGSAFAVLIRTIADATLTESDCFTWLRSDSLERFSLKERKDSGKRLGRHPRRALSIERAAYLEVPGLILPVL